MIFQSGSIEKRGERVVLGAGLKLDEDVDGNMVITGDGGDSGPPGGGAGASICVEVAMHAVGGAGFEIEDIGPELADVSPRSHQWFNATAYSTVRLVLQVRDPATQGTLVIAQYSYDGGLTWRFFDGAGGPTLAISSAGVHRGNWVAMEPQAKGDIEIRWCTYGGDGTTRAGLGKLAVEFMTPGDVVNPPPMLAPLAWHISDQQWDGTSQWSDLTGNENHLILAPGYIAPVAGSPLNGRTTLRFGTSLFTWPTSLYQGKEAGEGFVVVKLLTEGDGGGGLLYSFPFEGLSSISDITAAGWTLFNNDSGGLSNNTIELVTSPVDVGVQALHFNITHPAWIGGQAYYERTFSGLTPGVNYKMTARIRYEGRPWFQNPVFTVIGGGSSGQHYLEGSGASVADGQWATIWAQNVVDENGELTVRFGNSFMLGVSADFSAYFDGTLRIESSEPVGNGSAAVWRLGSDAAAACSLSSNVTENFGSAGGHNCGPATTEWTSAFRLWNVRSSLSEWAGLLNGQAQFSTATNTVGFTANPIFGAAGPYTPEGPALITGSFEVAEILLFDRVLLPSQRDQAIAELDGRWDLGISEVVNPPPPPPPSGSRRLGLSGYNQEYWGQYPLFDGAWPRVTTSAEPRPTDIQDFYDTLNAAREAGIQVLAIPLPRRSWAPGGGHTSFSLASVERKIDSYIGIDLTEWLADGTLLGIYYCDEPFCAECYGGQIIPPDTVDYVAKRVKQVFGQTVPTYLRVTGFNMERRKPAGGWRYTDACMNQYAGRSEDDLGTVAAFVAENEAARKRLGLTRAYWSLNVINGGDGSSGIPGTRDGRSKMSAAEVEANGLIIVRDAEVIDGLGLWAHFDPPDPIVKTNAYQAALTRVKTALVNKT